MRLKGKSAIVTGAASGIERAIAKKFATEGAHLVTADIDGSTAETVAEEIRADGGTAHSIATDITKRGDVYAMTDTAIDYFGKVDVLVNNAGSRIVKPILDHSEDDWQRMLDVNLTGHFHCCQAVLPHMLAAGFGRIVNVASVAGSVGRPNRIGYVAAKGGTLAMTRALAADMAGKNITVNALAPGMIASPMNQAVKENPDFGDNWNNDNLVRRWGKPEDVAGIAAFLASDEASFITGETINVDGGSIAALIRRGE
mgnify:FL=1